MANLTSKSSALNITHAFATSNAIFKHYPKTLNSDEYQTVKLLMVIVLTIMIISSNGLIVTVFATCRRLQKKPANFLITSQACSDLFTSLIFCPVHLIERYSNSITVEPFLICYMIFLSLFNLLALCLDRYLALSKPFLHHRLTGIQRVIKQIFWVWLTPFIITLLPLLWWYTHNRDTMNLAFLILIWTIMVVLVISMTAVYTSVSLKARRLIRKKRLSILSSKQEASFQESESLTRKELRVVHLFGLLLFLFVATYLPIIYMNFCDIINKVELIPNWLEETSFFIILLGSVLNPITSMYLKKDFHNSLKTRFRKNLLWKLRSSSTTQLDELVAETSFIVGPRSDSNNTTLFTTM